MKFRPLCIDYHSRAQEIIITERDYNSRRAAQSLLSHRLSELSPRHQDLDDELLALNDEDQENRAPSNSLGSDVDENSNDRKYHSGDSSVSENNERHAPTLRIGSNAIAPRSSARGNGSIAAVFGPTIPPSECEVRKISPVTAGPIRGRLLPVGEIPVMESIGLHAEITEEDFYRDTLSSLEGGKSTRQQLFIGDVSMLLGSGYLTACHPTNTSGETNNESNSNVETVLDTTKNAPPSPPYRLLRHEPEDLTKIQRMKSLHILNEAHFSSEVMEMLEPRQSSRSACGTHRVWKEKPLVSTNPNLSMISFDTTEMYNSDFAADSNSLSLTSFYEDCHGGLAAHPILQSRKLRPYAEDHLIRRDPDFDPSPCHDTSEGEEVELARAGSALTLGDFCSASYIAQELALPGRLKHKNDAKVALILNSSGSDCRKIDFVEKALDRFKESQMRDEALLSPFLRSDILDTSSFPKPITLESDLTLYDEIIEPMPSCQSGVQLDLPSFAESLPFSCSRKTTIRRSKPQKRFVDSSARVFKIDALSNICGHSNAACIYLPQIEVHDWRERISSNEQQQSTLNDNLISFVRECVSSSTIPTSIDALDGVDLLQGQTSNYPMLSWFTCDDDIEESEHNDHIYIDEAAVDLKRRTFCSNAVRVGDRDRSHCVLFTGCSSRCNLGRKYSYRGFLTNQLVNPQVFQQRYKSMIELNKICQRDNISVLSKRSASSQRSFHFSRMVVVDFADRFTARMNKKKLKQQRQGASTRIAPFALSLKNRRHGMLPLKQVGKKSAAVVIGKQSFVTPQLHRLSSSCHREESNISVDDTIARLGRENLNVRGELLHLVTKARELKEEGEAYQAELAVINRGREDTPNRDSFEDEIYNQVDTTAGGNGKREADSDIVIEEHDEERKARKKKKQKKDRKKDKKKKTKKEKKSHKRKRRDDVIDKEVDSDTAKMESTEQREEIKIQSTSTKKLRIDAPSTNRKSWKAIPSIELGITPIHRPKDKRLETQLPVQTHDNQKTLDKGDNSNTNSASHSLSSLEDSSSGKSPDSVAVTNLAGGLVFPEESPEGFPVMHSHGPDEDGKIREQEGDPMYAIDKNTAGYTESYNDGMTSKRTSEAKSSTFTILTSESFLELFGESIMELASGRWYNTLTKTEKLQLNCLLNYNHELTGNELDPGIPENAKLNVSDCPLLDIAGADIELADDKALIVQRNVDKSFIKRLVHSTLRYPSIHVILCVDDNTRPNDIVMMQNALTQNAQVSFEYSSTRTLSSSIALQYFNSTMSCRSNTPPDSSRISQFALDENVQERARFLICLVPTMTVHSALKCLCTDSSASGKFDTEDDGGAKAMHMLLCLARDTSRELFPHKVSSIMSKVCAEQLWLVVNTASSFATRQC